MDLSIQASIQEQMRENNCWGCGVHNPHGLGIRTHWDGEEGVCVWQPRPEFMGGPRNLLYGGTIASLIDCHCICTAIGTAYRVEGRPMSSDPMIWYATAALHVNFRKPVPIDQPLTLRARIAERTERKTIVNAVLTSGGIECADGHIVAVRVPAEDWFA